MELVVTENGARARILSEIATELRRMAEEDARSAHRPAPSARAGRPRRAHRLREQAGGPGPQTQNEVRDEDGHAPVAGAVARR